MCHINIIHFSHHHDFSPPAEEVPNTSSSSSSISTTSFSFNNCSLSNPTRLTEQEELISLQRLPQHQFVPCPTHTNNHCVTYKQTMPCLLQRFRSAADTTATAEVNANADSEESEGGINVSTCPNLEITHEHHPLSLIADINNNNVNESEAVIPGAVQHFHTSDSDSDSASETTLFQAKTALLLSTADEIHRQTVVLNTHVLETAELLEGLYRELALHTLTTHTDTQPTTFLLQQPTSTSYTLFKELEIPLHRASQLCLTITQADNKIRALFQTFLQRRKEMSDLLVHMAVLQQEEGLNNGAAYTITKAKQDLREMLSVDNLKEVCEGPLRRGREVAGEVVRLLEGVERFIMLVV